MLRVAGCIAVASALVLSVSVSPLRAQQPSRTSAVYEAWTVACAQQSDKKMACQVNQIQQPKGQPGPASEVAMSQKPGSKTVQVTFQVPPNVSIPQGVRLVLEGKPGKDKKPERIGSPIVAPVRLCLASRCIAQVDISEEVVRSILRAESGLIVFNQADEREVSIQFSFQGFGAAWKDAQKSGAGANAAAAHR